jgi:hypothetical protein
LDQCPSWSYRASFDGKDVVGWRPNFADGPAASDNFHLLGLLGLPLAVSMGTTLFALIKLSEIFKTNGQQRQALFLSNSQLITMPAVEEPDIDLCHHLLVLELTRYNEMSMSALSTAQEQKWALDALPFGDHR